MCDTTISCSSVETLSAEHAIVFSEIPGAANLEYLEAIGSVIGSSHICSIFKTNGIVKIYLKDKKFVKEVISSGVSVRGQRPQGVETVHPISKLLLLKVDPLIPDSYIQKCLSAFGTIETSVQRVKISDHPDFSHIETGVREVSLRIHGNPPIPKSLVLTHGDICCEIQLSIEGNYASGVNVGTKNISKISSKSVTSNKERTLKPSLSRKCVKKECQIEVDLKKRKTLAAPITKRIRKKVSEIVFPAEDGEKTIKVEFDTDLQKCTKKDASPDENNTVKETKNTAHKKNLISEVPENRVYFNRTRSSKASLNQANSNQQEITKRQICLKEQKKEPECDVLTNNIDLNIIKPKKTKIDTNQLKLKSKKNVFCESKCVISSNKVQTVSKPLQTGKQAFVSNERNLSVVAKRQSLITGVRNASITAKSQPTNEHYKIKDFDTRVSMFCKSKLNTISKRTTDSNEKNNTNNKNITSKNISHISKNLRRKSTNKLNLQNSSKKYRNNKKINIPFHGSIVSKLELTSQKKTLKLSKSNRKQCLSEYDFTSSDSSANEVSYSEYKKKKFTKRKRSNSVGSSVPKKIPNLTANFEVIMTELGQKFKIRRKIDTKVEKVTLKNSSSSKKTQSFNVKKQLNSKVSKLTVIKQSTFSSKKNTRMLKSLVSPSYRNVIKSSDIESPCTDIIASDVVKDRLIKPITIKIKGLNNCSFGEGAIKIDENKSSSKVDSQNMQPFSQLSKLNNEKMSDNAVSFSYNKVNNEYHVDKANHFQKEINNGKNNVCLKQTPSSRKGVSLKIKNQTVCSIVDIDNTNSSNKEIYKIVKNNKDKRNVNEKLEPLNTIKDISISENLLLQNVDSSISNLNVEKIKVLRKQKDASLSKSLCIVSDSIDTLIPTDKCLKMLTHAQVSSKMNEKNNNVLNVVEITKTNSSCHQINNTEKTLLQQLPSVSENVSECIQTDSNGNDYFKVCVDGFLQELANYNVCETNEVPSSLKNLKSLDVERDVIEGVSKNSFEQIVDRDIKSLLQDMILKLENNCSLLLKDHPSDNSSFFYNKILDTDEMHDTNDVSNSNDTVNIKEIANTAEIANANEIAHTNKIANNDEITSIDETASTDKAEEKSGIMSHDISLCRGDSEFIMYSNKSETNSLSSKPDLSPVKLTCSVIEKTGDSKNVVHTKRKKNTLSTCRKKKTKRYLDDKNRNIVDENCKFEMEDVDMMLASNSTTEVSQGLVTVDNIKVEQPLQNEMLEESIVNTVSDDSSSTFKHYETEKAIQNSSLISKKDVQVFKRKALKSNCQLATMTTDDIESFNEPKIKSSSNIFNSMQNENLKNIKENEISEEKEILGLDFQPFTVRRDFDNEHEINSSSNLFNSMQDEKFPNTENEIRGENQILGIDPIKTVSCNDPLTKINENCLVIKTENSVFYDEQHSTSNEEENGSLNENNSIENTTIKTENIQDLTVYEAEVMSQPLLSEKTFTQNRLESVLLSPNEEEAMEELEPISDDLNASIGRNAIIKNEKRSSTETVIDKHRLQNSSIQNVMIKGEPIIEQDEINSCLQVHTSDNFQTIVENNSVSGRFDENLNHSEISTTETKKCVTPRKFSLKSPVKKVSPTCFRARQIRNCVMKRLQTNATKRQFLQNNTLSACRKSCETTVSSEQNVHYSEDNDLLKNVKIESVWDSPSCTVELNTNAALSSNTNASIPSNIDAFLPSSDNVSLPFRSSNTSKNGVKHNLKSVLKMQCGEIINMKHDHQFVNDKSPTVKDVVSNRKRSIHTLRTRKNALKNSETIVSSSGVSALNNLEAIVQSLKVNALNNSETLVRSSELNVLNNSETTVLSHEVNALNNSEAIVQSSKVNALNEPESTAQPSKVNALNNSETIVLSTEVNPSYDNIYSIYKNISKSRANCPEKSFVDFPLNKREFMYFLEASKQHKNPKRLALRLLERNKVEGALKDLIIQLYDYFNLCKDNKRRLRISHLIMLLNER